MDTWIDSQMLERIFACISDDTIRFGRNRAIEMNESGCIHPFPRDKWNTNQTIYVHDPVSEYHDVNYKTNETYRKILDGNRSPERNASEMNAGMMAYSNQSMLLSRGSNGMSVKNVCVNVTSI